MRIPVPYDNIILYFAQNCNAFVDLFCEVHTQVFSLHLSCTGSLRIRRCVKGLVLLSAKWDLRIEGMVGRDEGLGSHIGICHIRRGVMNKL